jgi:hypothetical protein
MVVSAAAGLLTNRVIIHHPMRHQNQLWTFRDLCLLAFADADVDVVVNNRLSLSLQFAPVAAVEVERIIGSCGSASNNGQ